MADSTSTRKGPSEISATVKAYFALKLAGFAVNDSRMVRLRERILALGGLQAANSYVKVNLSLFDLYPREHCPTIPPEIVLLPGNCSTRCLRGRARLWFRSPSSTPPIRGAPCPPASIWMSFGTRAPILVPPESPIGWRNLFLAIDHLLKLWERAAPRPFDAKRSRRPRSGCSSAHRSDGLGAIYPPMMYSVMALDVLGFAPDHPLRVEALRQFDALMVDDGERFFFQPCFSPVWDTAIAAYALGESGYRRFQRCGAAADWLLRTRNPRPRAIGR